VCVQHRRSAGATSIHAIIANLIEKVTFFLSCCYFPRANLPMRVELARFSVFSQITLLENPAIHRNMDTSGERMKDIAQKTELNIFHCSETEWNL
jgi:hypothetical protein